MSSFLKLTTLSRRIKNPREQFSFMEFYRQTSMYTGAATALLMAIHAKDSSVQLSRENEFRIWMQSCNLPTRSSSIYGLGVVAHEYGVPAHIVVEEEEYDYPDYRFKRYKKVEIEDAKLASRIHADTAKQKGIEIETRDFELTEVEELLSKGKLLLLRVNAGIFRDKKATSKFVLVTRKDGDEYVVMDPEQGEIHVSDEEMQRAFDTLATKKKRDHRMLILG